MKKTTQKKAQSNIELPEEQTSGIPSLCQIHMLLYGPPKIGKTTLASGFPNTIFLATEKGYASHKVYKIDIKSWFDFKEAVKLLTTQKHSFKTIVIDTVDVLYNQCVDTICKKLKITHQSDEGFGKGYDIISKEFEKIINQLFLSDYGLILISHTKIVEITSRGGKITKIVPTIPNSARRVLLPKVSIIAYMDTKLIEIKPKKFIERRIISFTPSEILEAGDRDGKLPNEIITSKNPKKTYEIFEKAYNTK